MPRLHDLIEEADQNADAVCRWIDDWRRTHPGQDVRPLLNATAVHNGFDFPATPLFVAIPKPVDVANPLISVLLENGADPNKTAAYSGGLKVSPLDFAIEAYLAYPVPAAFETIEMLIKKHARYGDGWRASCFDVGRPGGDRAQAGCLAGAAARVLAFAECVELHMIDVWDNVDGEPGAEFLANALNGFSMPYRYTDPNEARLAMWKWCGPQRRPGSVADVVLKLQESPEALNMTLKSVDPQERGTCGNNAAYNAFIALNAVPLYEALARGATEFSHLKRAALAGSSLSAAHLLASRVHERIGTFEREMGPAQTPVSRGSQVEYLHRVTAAVGALLPRELANRLYAVLPNESLVPSGNHAHRACSLHDHDSFINCLAVDCAGVLRGERPDLLIDALASAGGVRAIWQEHLLACVDRQWDSLQVTAPGESRRDLLEKVAKRRTPDAVKISDDMTERIDKQLNDAEFKRICDDIRDQREIVTGQFCHCLTTTIVENPPSFFAKAGVTKKAVVSALQGRSIKEVTATPSPSLYRPSGRVPPTNVSRTPYR
ncbi:hypothetical protein LMG19083_04688 [Ralstonia psammae]|uniref:Ankyrin n=1 Tax=Ralstonia psammae TaxID=3058598 RepID=A0ABM9JYC5_9RALS|nr:hypothetical protein [Ralstonia sp. LMG 19083]CAJ0808325.1 hypothetical protein LMG19083_04688 [Ralstonia sp. LMG 19083]